MATNFIRKLMVANMELVFLFLFEVHANHLGSASFHPSSFSIPFDHLSKIDKIQKPYHDCLIKKFIRCEQKVDKIERALTF